MQTEWSPGRDDQQGSDAPDPDPASAVIGGWPAVTPSDPVVGPVVDAVDHDEPVASAVTEVPGDPTVLVEPADGMSDGEEDAHRTAVDAVDTLLDEVELALSRLDDGTYGRCESCGDSIADADLTARPLVRACASCSTEMLQPESV